MDAGAHRPEPAAGLVVEGCACARYRADVLARHAVGVGAAGAAEAGGGWAGGSVDGADGSDGTGFPGHGGNTAKAFDGEEVDWYVCNVASYHVKQSMDVSLALVENEDLKRWLLLAGDETVSG